MPSLRIFLLGSLDIWVGGQQLPKPPTLKSQSLLAYLALHRPLPQPRERLAELFWGDRSERRARRSLTTALWHIRRCLTGEQFLICDVQSIRFDPAADLWLDTAEFEALVAQPVLASLQSAVALYRGDFLDGFYDEWIISERYRLEALFTETLMRLMLSLEAMEDIEGALTTGLQLLQRDSLREDAHRLVMRAFCRLGQRNAALDQYRRCQQIVMRELNVEPMTETTALYHAILDGRFKGGPAVDVLPGASYIIKPVIPAGKNPLDSLSHLSLVGRAPEMAFLKERFEEAQAGRGGLVLIEGETGVGKTRLVEEFADYLRCQGVRVLWGRCYEFERLLPYQPFGEVLQTVLSTLTPNDLADLPAWILSELVRLVPELSEKAQGLLPGSPMPLDQDQLHFFEGVARFLAGLSMQGALVLILDDLHWATESSLQLIHYLTRLLAKDRVLFVGTLRPETAGPQHGLHTLQNQLNREGLVGSLNLEGLSPQAIQELVTEISGSCETAIILGHRFYQETEGNPFVLMEIFKTLFELKLISLKDGVWSGDFTRISESKLPLPAGLTEAIQARLNQLDRVALDVMQVAAVLGREFDFDLLNVVLKQSEEVTLEALDTLLRRRFIREGSGILGLDYAFHHHKIQEVVYAGIPFKRRQRLHASVAKVMENLNATNLQAATGELAFHFSQGCKIARELEPDAVRYLLLAGDQARLAYAHREAIAYYTQALGLQKEMGEVEQAGRTLMKIGLVHHINFDFDQARRAFEDGFNQWQHAGKQEAQPSREPASHAMRIRWRSPYTLDPGLSDDYVSALVIDLLLRGLVSSGPELELEPEAAQRWQVLDGGRKYLFQLRKGMCWSDGAPLTAHDFAYAWKRLLDPATGADPSMLLAIKGARAFHMGQSTDDRSLGILVRDDLTLEVDLEEPVSHFLYQLAHVNTYPIPEHIVGTHTKYWTDVDKIVTNGPFLLEAWDRGKSMRLKHNPLYPRRCRGNVKQVVLDFPQDYSSRDLAVPLEQYIQGDLDVLTLTDASVQEGDRIRRQFAADYLSAPWLFTIYLGCVTSQPPFDDVRLRQALALGINRDELANQVLQGMYTAGSGGFVPPGMPGHSAQIGFPYDPSLARQLLCDSGFPAGSGLAPLQALTVPPIDPLVSSFLQAQWQENLGIRVVWDVLDWPQFNQKLQFDAPHLYILANFASIPDPICFLAADGICRSSRWVNPAYETLLEKAGHTLDQGVRIELLRQADQLLMHEAPIIPLFYGRQHLLVQPWVRSSPISALNRWFWQDTILEPH